jgi:RNA polymerase sigma-70 factor (ECF subfamily)
LETISDRILVRQVQANNRGAYEILITRHYRRIYAICIGIVTDPHQSQDLCQEAMLRGYEKIDHLRDPDRFGGWLTEITRNLCINWLRKQKSERTMISRLADPPDASSEKSAKVDIEIEDAVAKLPLELRLPLVMYYMDGCNSQAIAEQLNISNSTVCRRLRQAKRCLYEIVNEV